MSIKYKICILANESSDDHLYWVKVLETKPEIIDYSVINITRNGWLDEVILSNADVFIARPPGISEQYKNLYDERLFIISKVLKKKIYPSFEEILVYENKKFLAYFLKANDIPHPATSVFYYKDEALEYVTHTTYPLVAKVNIGASGSGVVILKTKREAEEYINKVFDGRGAPKRWGPNFEKGNLIKRGMYYFIHPKDILKKLKIYSSKLNSRQIGYLIFQEFINHSFEWRCVRIGDSFFAHKKLVIGEKASGTLLKNYDNPPLQLLDFVKEITDRLSFNSLAIDIFENSNGDYLVNEMQCYFGQSDPYQMMSDDKIGRYRFINGVWVFEEGDYARNACYNLRLEQLLLVLENELR